MSSRKTTRAILPVLACLLGSLLGGVAMPMKAQACSLALSLGLDTSSSVDAKEYRKQTDGLAAALVDPDVIATILGSGGIYLTAFEWSGRTQHVLQLDWTWLNSEEAIRAASTRLRNSIRQYIEFPTAIGYALGFAAIHFQQLPQSCLRRVVDISGDGVNNEGFSPVIAYRAFDYSDITVNGLVIKGSEPDPEPYYREKLVNGPGAFVEVADNYDDFQRAMKRKLLREIRGGAVVMR